MRLKVLIFILAVSLLLRIYGLENVIVFPDMEWYSESAKLARETGNIPLLGITSSITWLHQGALWTYLMLIPVPPQIISISLGVISVVLAYFSTGLIAALLMAVLPFAVLHSQIAYHTSPIPFLFFLTFVLIMRRRSILAGLFIGFLYQSHLLTFIYWPLWLVMLYRHKIGLLFVSFGFVLGVLPFILSGPIQMFGIFAWITKQLLTGFDGATSGVSTAYQVVLFPGVILLFGRMVQLIYAFSRRFGAKRSP